LLLGAEINGHEQREESEKNLDGAVIESLFTIICMLSASSNLCRLSEKSGRGPKLFARALISNDY
jgi:hypothetical protein